MPGLHNDHRHPGGLRFTITTSPATTFLLDIAGDICGCRGGALLAIGGSVSEMLDWVPAQLPITRITRPKYACRICNKIAQASAPERLIAGRLATPALLAQVLVSKYCDHTFFADDWLCGILYKLTALREARIQLIFQHSLPTKASRHRIAWCRS